MKHESGPCTKLILVVIVTIAAAGHVQLSVLQLLPSSVVSILLVGSEPVHSFLNIECGQSPLYMINNSKQCEFTL